MSITRALAAALALACSAGAAVTSGPAVGSPLPNFEAADQNGTPRSFKSLLGPKGAMLVFFRSADW
jgi:hypothetical protein